MVVCQSIGGLYKVKTLSLKYKIAVFTSIRSEYGHLSALLKNLFVDEDFSVQLVVAGAHLLRSQGYTINQIEKDGFPIALEIPFLFADSRKDVLTRSLGVLQQRIGEFFYENNIDLLIVLGDRMELIPVVTSALMMNVAIAHISGGETTSGAIDNQIRHSITKLSHLHFPANYIYKENIIRMGEEKWRICVSGELGLDLIPQMNFLKKQELFDQLGLSIGLKTILMTFHNETISNEITTQYISSIVKSILQNTDYQILATASNIDDYKNDINDLLQKIANDYLNFAYTPSLGQLKYYSMLKFVDIVIGNSSSGIIETQSFEVPTINIGNRQLGRLSNPCVLHISLNDDILINIKKVTSHQFINSFKGQPNLYGDGNASDKIIDFIKLVKHKDLLLKEDQFYSN